MKITITDLANVSDQVKKNIDKAVEASLPEAAEIIQSSIEENFIQGGRWDGKGNLLTSGGTQKWKPLADSTKAQYKKKGYTTERTLNRSAAGLASSVEVAPVGSDGISMSSNKVYARIQQLGGESKPGVHIPASPYLVLQLEDIEDIAEVIAGNY